MLLDEIARSETKQSEWELIRDRSTKSEQAQIYESPKPKTWIAKT